MGRDPPTYPLPLRGQRAVRPSAGAASRDPPTRRGLPFPPAKSTDARRSLLCQLGAVCRWRPERAGPERTASAVAERLNRNGGCGNPPICRRPDSVPPNASGSGPVAVIRHLQTRLLSPSRARRRLSVPGGVPGARCPVRKEPFTCCVDAYCRTRRTCETVEAIGEMGRERSLPSSSCRSAKPAPKVPLRAAVDRPPVPGPSAADRRCTGRIGRLSNYSVHRRQGKTKPCDFFRDHGDVVRFRAQMKRPADGISVHRPCESFRRTTQTSAVYGTSMQAGGAKPAGCLPKSSENVE